MMAQYYYELLNRQGEAVETQIPDETQANTVMNFYAENHPHDGPFSINKVQIYSVKGLGRDPDLH